MSDFIDQLKIEKEELSEKKQKLFEFIRSSGYHKLSEGNQRLLGMQSNIMVDYESILIARIELNDNQEYE